MHCGLWFCDVDLTGLTGLDQSRHMLSLVKVCCAVSLNKLLRRTPSATNKVSSGTGYGMLQLKTTE